MRCIIVNNAMRFFSNLGTQEVCYGRKISPILYFVLMTEVQINVQTRTADSVLCDQPVHVALNILFLI
jgi:hypothetical protein